jgi:hypothetical protein
VKLRDRAKDILKALDKTTAALAQAEWKWRRGNIDPLLEHLEDQHDVLRGAWPAFSIRRFKVCARAMRNTLNCLLECAESRR